MPYIVPTYNTSQPLSDGNKTLAEQIKCVAEAMYERYKNAKRGTNATNSGDYVQLWKDYWDAPDPFHNNTKRDAIFASFSGYQIEEGLRLQTPTYVSYCAVTAWLVYYRASSCFGGIKGQCLVKSSRVGRSIGGDTRNTLYSSQIRKSKTPEIGSFMLRESEVDPTKNGHVGVVIDVNASAETFTCFEGNGKLTRETNALFEIRTYTFAEFNQFQNGIFLHVQDCETVSPTLVTNLPSWCCPEEKPCPDCPEGYRRRDLTDLPPSPRINFATEAEYLLQKCCVKKDVAPECPTCPTGWEKRTGAPGEPPDPTAGKMRPPREDRDRDPNDPPPKVWAAGEWEAWKQLNKCCYRHIYNTTICPESLAITRITKDCLNPTYVLRFPEADEVPHYSWFADDTGNGQGMRQGFFSSVIKRGDITGRHGRTNNTSFMNFIQSVPMVRIGEKSHNCTAMAMIGTSELNGIMSGSNMPSWVGQADGETHSKRVQSGLNLYPKQEDAIWIVIPRTGFIDGGGLGPGYAERIAEFFNPSNTNSRQWIGRLQYSLNQYPALKGIYDEIQNNIKEKRTNNPIQPIKYSDKYRNLFNILQLFEQSLNKDATSFFKNKTIIFYFPGEPADFVDSITKVAGIVSFATNLILPGSSVLVGNIVSATTGVLRAIQNGFQIEDLFTIAGAIAQQLADKDIADGLGLDSEVFQQAGKYISSSQNIYTAAKGRNAGLAVIGAIQQELKVHNTNIPEVVGSVIGDKAYSTIDAFARGAYHDVNQFLNKTSKEAQGILSNFAETVTIDKIKQGLSFGDTSVAMLYNSILGNSDVSISQLGFIQDILSARPAGQAFTTVPGIQNIVAGAFKVDNIRQRDFNSPEILRSMLGIATGRLALDSHFDQLLFDSMRYKAEDFTKRNLTFQLPPVIDKCKREAIYDEIRVCIKPPCEPPKKTVNGFCITPPPREQTPPPPTPPKQKECFEFDGVVKYNHPDGYQCQMRMREWVNQAGGAYPGQWRSDKYVYDIVLAIEKGEDNPDGRFKKQVVDYIQNDRPVYKDTYTPQRDWEMNCGDGWYDAFSGKYGQLQWKSCVATPPTDDNIPPCIRKDSAGKWWFCPDEDFSFLNDGEVSHTLLQKAAAHLGKPDYSKPLNDEFIDIYNTPSTMQPQQSGYITELEGSTPQQQQYIDVPLSRPGVTTKVPINTTNTNTANTNTSTVKNPCYPASQDGSGAWFALLNNKWVRIIDCKLDSQVECCDKLEKQIEELKKTIKESKDNSSTIVLDRLSNLQREFDSQKELLKVLVEKVSNVQDYSQKFENIEKRLEEIANKPEPKCDLEPVITLIKNSKSSFNYDDSKIIQKLDEHSKALEILIKRPNAACPDCDTSELAKRIEEQRNAILQLSNRINEFNNTALVQAIQNLVQQFTSIQNSNTVQNTNLALKLNQTYDLIVRLLNKPDCCYDDSELQKKIDKILSEPPRIEKSKEGTYYDDSELKLFIRGEFEKYSELLNQKTICPPIIQQQPPQQQPPCPGCPPPTVNCPDCPSPCRDYDDRLINKKLDETKELLIRLVEQPDNGAYDDSFVRSKLEQIYSRMEQNITETRSSDAQLRQYITEQIQRYSQQYNDTDLRSFIYSLVSRIQPGTYNDSSLRAFIEEKLQSVKFDETKLREFISQKIAESKTQGYDDKSLREYIYALISRIPPNTYDDSSLRAFIEQKLSQYNAENQAYFNQVATFIIQKIGEIPQSERYDDTSLRQYIAAFFSKLPNTYDDRELKRLIQVLIDRPSIDITSIQSKLDALLTKQWTVNTTTTGTGQVVNYDDSQLRALILQQMALLQKLQTDCINNSKSTELLTEFSSQKRKLEEIVSLIQNGVNETTLQNSINTIAERIKALETVMQSSSTSLQLQSLRSDIASQRTLLSTLQNLLSNVQSQLQSKTNYDDTQLRNLLNEIKQSVTLQKNYDDTQLRNQVSTLENVVRSLTDQLKNQTTSSSIAYNDTQLRNQITQLQEAISRINTSAQSSQFNDTGIMNKLDAMTRELTSVITSRATYDDTQIRNQLNSMNSVLQTILSRQQQGSTTYNDTQLRNQVSALDTLIRQVQTDLNNKNFSYNDTQLRNQITALDTAIKNIKVTGVAYNDTAIQSKMDTMTAMVKELQSRRSFDDSNIINRLNSLQSQILTELQRKFNYDDTSLRSEIAKLSQYVQGLKFEQSSGTSQYNDTVLQSKIDEIQRNIRDLQSRRTEMYNDTFLREQLQLMRNDISTLLNKKAESYNDGEVKEMLKIQTQMIGELLARKCTTYDDSQLRGLIQQILQKDQYDDSDLRAELKKMQDDYGKMQKAFDDNFKALAAKMQPTIIDGGKQTVNCGDCKEKFDELSRLYSSQQEGWLQRFTALKEQLSRIENFTERTSGEKSETVSPPSLPPNDEVVPQKKRGKRTTGYITDDDDCPDCPKVIERHERIIYDFPKRNHRQRKSPCRNC